ncbi:Zn-dependent exopeptidase [Durotheca rogersii]|uniref:Zn-dependent exopeptidase n=1 Tax=Durotheca rogersii TaxID=419775 RepID=UPI002220F44A|nr:Zn-dependent exopeptidase [Durotheca rogersii]KAI5866688.1 Zn-dependent exopeptidase [Durotheca rogersii]
MKSSLVALLLPAAATARFIETTELNHILPPTDVLLAERPAAPSAERPLSKELLQRLGETTQLDENVDLEDLLLQYEADRRVRAESGDEAKYLIELSPGETLLVTEDEKWELRRSGKQFMDITDHGDLGTHRSIAARTTPVFPGKVQLQSEIHPLLKNLSKDLMREHLEKFTSFHTRYYKSDYGRQSSEWLLKTVQETIVEAGADKFGVKAEHFEHSWGQNSVIATIPGKSNATIVIGAHQDSINLWLPSVLPAPGADDDGSGTVTILEAFRVLLSSESVVNGNVPNTIEFHWYSAEEGGLLGSQAIFSDYEKKGRDVKAMLQQDMTGYVQGTLDAGNPESVGVITDFVDPALTAFIKKVIEEYCEIPWVETKCGYACSDHASASKAGYPSAFVIESTFDESDQLIHSTSDLIKYLSFDHMLQHARMTLSLVYELGFADFKELESENAVGEL